MDEKLQKKVDRAIRLLQSITLKGDEPIEIAYSGGKDSDVILELARMAKIKHKAIYKCTTIDPPGTIKHAIENGVEIRRPRKTFFQLLCERGIPSMFRRFCCEYLKEYPILYNCIIGVRKAESVKRNERYQEPIVCRVYNKKKDLRVQQILPILDWTDEEELTFIKERNIRLHPLYYTNDGQIDIKRRLGCLCCPLKSKNKRLEDFLRYPKMMRQYVRNAKIFLDTHPDSKVHSWANSVYEYVYAEIFSANHKEYMLAKQNNLFDGQSPDEFKAFLESFFKVNLDLKDCKSPNFYYNE